MTAKKLTQKQADFVREYLVDLNATKAYMRVYTGSSEGAARRNASRLMTNDVIQAAISAERQKTAESIGLTRERVLAQYERLGFSDPRKIFDAYGQIKPITDLDDDTAAAIQGIEVEYRQLDGPDSDPVPVLKIKMADRKAALDAIMKAQGWNSAEKHEVTGKNGQPIQHAVRVVLVPPKEKAVVTTRQLDKAKD